MSFHDGESQKDDISPKSLGWMDDTVGLVVGMALQFVQKTGIDFCES
jgi:hypothetical protein